MPKYFTTIFFMCAVAYASAQQKEIDSMLQSSNGKQSPVTINDLVNADGSAAGTEVIIKMPVIY